MEHHHTATKFFIGIGMALFTATAGACDPEAGSAMGGLDMDVEYRVDQTEALEALEARVLQLERLHYFRRAFVTSTKYDATFGGVLAADAICQGHADAAGLGGTWMAWMSDSVNGTPTDNFTHSPYDYTLVDGTVIASNWDDLVDGELGALIGLDENGDARTGYVWTGTTSEGAIVTQLCSDWTSTSYSGKVGSANDDNGGTSPQWWSTRGNLSCGSTARLYCFEQ
ncbi:MAG: DUF1554 domain-containing protein [Myxococcales bacterium]|nr:DUF1554 domain-containing protein [Myxococcales bacterium]